MGLESFFVFLVVFGVVGYFTEKFYGINPYKVYSDVGSIVLLGAILFLFFPLLMNPENITNNVDRIANFVKNYLPGALIGDIAGSFVSKITGESK